MIFPKWVNKPGLTKQERASNRLRYILLQLAIEFDRSATLQKLANKVGFSHSYISLHVTRGYFNTSLAIAFEHAFGRDKCPNEWLLDPLSIPSTR